MRPDILNFCQVSIRRSAQKNFQPLNEFHRGVRHIGQVSIPCDVDCSELAQVEQFGQDAKTYPRGVVV